MARIGVVIDIGVKDQSTLSLVTPGLIRTHKPPNPRTQVQFRGVGVDRSEIGVIDIEIAIDFNLSNLDFCFNRA